MPLSDEDRAELVAYLDGELDEQATLDVEARLATDPEARAELDTLRQTWGMLDYLPRAEPSANFTHRTLEKLSLEQIRAVTGSKSVPVPSSQRWPAWFLSCWAAALLLAVGMGYWGAPHLFPTTGPEPTPEGEEPLVRHLRLVEKWRYYENVDDREFIDELAQSDLFGDESR